MNLFNETWLTKKITFKPSDFKVQSMWAIRFGGSRALLMEGPSGSTDFGEELFTVLAMGREINKDDPNLWVCLPE